MRRLASPAWKPNSPLSLMQLVHTGRLSLADMIAKFTVNPARLLNLRKGTLSVGAARGRHSFRSRPLNVDLRARGFREQIPVLPPFFGWKLKGWAVATIVAGKNVLLNSRPWRQSKFGNEKNHSWYPGRGRALVGRSARRILSGSPTCPRRQLRQTAEKNCKLMDFTGSGTGVLAALDLKSSAFDTKAISNLRRRQTLFLLSWIFLFDKKPQPAELKKANADLHDKYKVEGYPTLVILDQNGRGNRPPWEWLRGGHT